MEKRSSRQTNSAGSGARFAWQVARLMIWPVLTVLLATGMIYFERMHIVKKEVVARGRILAESVSVLLEEGLRSAAYDLNSPAIDTQLQSIAGLYQSGDGGSTFIQRLFSELDALKIETGELYLADIGSDKLIPLETSVSESSSQNRSGRRQLPGWPGIAVKDGDNFFSGDALYCVRSFSFPSMGRKEKINSPGVENKTFLVVRIPPSYFRAEKKSSLRLLLVAAAALLIPSLVVCICLARSRNRVRVEEMLRAREHENHLAQLEEKVRKRTRDLDDSNLHLSAEIAERLTTENRLRGINELLTVMLESIDGLIYVVDMDTHEILFANEYVRRLFGFDPVGRSCFQFIHSNQEGPCSFCTNSKLLDTDGNPADPIHWEYRNPFNKKWYSAKAQAIVWSNGKYVRLEIAVDITEQKRLQRFLEEARRQAELAIGTRSRFVAMVAHDMKSPFFSITQMLRRILERETFEHQVHREFLENIVENGHRMLQMIDNLLSMDRFETGEAKIERVFFDVSAMTDEVLQNFRHPAFEKGIRLLNNVPENTMLFADKYLYFMVLNNLVSNAVKFSDRGCSIDIYQPDENRKMTIAVRDNGCGMSEEYVENLFKEDVKTTHRGTGGETGSGLGLIFCSDIIKAHQGSIRVDSKRGRGTIFYIELPECSKMDCHRPEDCR